MEKRLVTVAIQYTIDRAAEAAGKTRVIIPVGHTFLKGTIKLRSNIDRNENHFVAWAEEAAQDEDVLFVDLNKIIPGI